MTIRDRVVARIGESKTRLLEADGIGFVDARAVQLEQQRVKDRLDALAVLPSAAPFDAEPMEFSPQFIELLLEDDGL